jgi:predicted NACHT family NTPase
MEPTAVVTAAIKLATEFVKRQAEPSAKEIRTIRVEIQRHLTETLNWSSRIQFYGMSRAEETDLATISLRLASEPRRFRAKRVDHTQTEDALLADNRNYLLLGDPGAGKTTTLKRIARKLLLEPPVAVDDIYQFPIVIRLRDLTSDETIVGAIARELGFPISERTEPETKKKSLWLADTRVADAVTQFLNTAHVLLLLDGLDEVPTEAQLRIRREVSWLALNANESKLIASCRSGDYTAVIEGLDLVEICPLEPQQVAEIAATWLDDPQVFLEQLARVPYRDVVDRPLLLSQLLYLYKRYGYLPEQPAQVYRKVIGLLLQEWDAEREIQRRSKYAGFDPDRKAAFLAALAYYLTFGFNEKYSAMLSYVVLMA